VAIDVRVDTVIGRPRADVARYAMAPENEPIWISGISQSKLLTDPPVRVGTQVERVAGFMGKRIEYVLGVVEHEPERRIVMETVRGPFPMRVTYAFEDENGDTRARLRVQGETEGFYRLAAPLMAGQVRRSLTRDLANLKRLTEGAATAAR
jgi:uncharacterized membrane protein